MPSAQESPLLVEAKPGVDLPILATPAGTQLSLVRGTKYQLSLDSTGDLLHVKVLSEDGEELGTFPKTALKPNMFTSKIHMIYRNRCLI